MKISDIVFPPPLLAALRDARLVVFAGAGVSMGKPAFLPRFRALAKSVAQGTGHTPLEHEPDDVFLGRLQHQGVEVHEPAARALRKNTRGDTPEPTALHRDLLRLFPDPGSVRIVTTNFDLLFTDAAQALFSEQPDVFKAPALPLGRTFTGIVHVHGCLDRPADMVLTDADFGRAYLIEGWARRFLVDLFGSSTVLFVGYSHNDTVMKYLARALPARESQTRFALTDQPAGDDWPVLGIVPIPYPRDPGDDHRSLTEGVGALANHARRGLLDWRQEITQIAQRAPPIDEGEGGIIEDALADVTKAKFFADAATDPKWLDWLDGRGHLDPLFGTADPPSPHLRLAAWMVNRFTFDRPAVLFRLIARHGMRLNPRLWHDLARALAFRTEPPLSGESLSRWASCLLATAPPVPDRDHLVYLARRCAQADLFDPLVQIFDALAAHRLLDWPPVPEFEEGYDDDIDPFAEDEDALLTVQADSGQLHELWENELRPRLDAVAESLLPIAVERLAARHRTFLAWQTGDRDWDPESSCRPAIEPHEQGHGSDHADVLIDAARDCLEWLASKRPEAASGWCDQFARSETPLLRRLCVHALSARTDISADEKLDWLFTHFDLYDDAARHELFRIMRKLYPHAGPQRRERMIAIVRDFRGSDEEEEDRARIAARHQFDRLHWLHDADPGCAVVRQALDNVRRQYPDFTPRELPDLTHLTQPQFGHQSPWSVEELLSRSAAEWIHGLLSFSPESPLGPDRPGLVSAVATAAVREFRWAADLAAGLVARGHWDVDLWIALFRAWRGAGLAASQLDEVFQFLREPRLCGAHARRVADLLRAWLETPGESITADLLRQANSIASCTWTTIDRRDVPEPCDSWHSLAVGSPAGALAEYWLRQRSLLRERSVSLPDALLADVTSALTEIVRDSSVAGIQARAVLAGHLAFLLDTEEEWTRQNLLPWFTRQPGTQPYQAVWDGFLAHGRLVPFVGECLKDAFLEAVTQIPVHFASARRRDRFVDYYVWMVAHVADDPVGTWIPKFFEHAGGEARGRFASQVGRHLRRMDDPRQREWWGRWLKCYWDGRLDGVPRPLDDREIRHMLAWLPALKSLFPTAAQLAIRMRPAPLGFARAIHDFHSGSHCGDFPEDVARLLVHFGTEPSLGPAWTSAPELISTLLENPLPGDLREALQELAARLGRGP